jgi:energy-coupling factor transporter ATP-binding protein EcfA2
MELLRRAEGLSEAYQLLDPDRPLEGAWLKHFYADRPEEASIAPLIDGLSLDPRDDDKTIFTGHRGSGKTTELARLEEKLQDTHTVVRFNVEELLNLGDVDYTDLLVVLGLQVFRAARTSRVRLDERWLDDLLFWYTTRILEQDEKRKLKSEVGGELNAILAKVSVKLATDAPRRQTVRAEARANLSDLLERLNALLLHLAERSGRRTLVIVDGLDKIYDRNQVHDLFCQGAPALLEPRCRIVYTVPLALYHTNDFQHVRMSFPRNFSLANVKAHEPDGTPCAEGRRALLEVLDCRLMPGLLAPEAAERLVDLCGGLLKELIALARSAARGPVQADDVEYAARQVRNTYRALLTEEQYRELWKLYQGRPFVNSPVARELLHNLSLLQYDGGPAWWGVHPIVRALLEERAEELEGTTGGGKAI